MLKRASSTALRSRVATGSRRLASSLAITERVPPVPVSSPRFGGRQQTFVSQAFARHALFVRNYASLPPHSRLPLPALSPTMETGRIIKWRKQEGEKVNANEVVAEVETDKATVDFEVTDEFYLAKILVPENAGEVKVGTAIAITVDNQADVAAFKDYKDDAAAAPAAKPAPAKEEPKPQEPAAAAKPAAPAAPSAPAAAPAVEEGPFVAGQPPKLPPPKPGFASPLARSVAQSAGVDLRAVQGSGPNGRIVQSDVAAAAAQAPAQYAAPAAAAVGSAGTYTDVPNTSLRKVIATRLSQSKQTVPHYYLTAGVKMDAVLKLRTQLNEKANGAYKLSVNDFVIKASSLALKKVPAANSQWNNEFIRKFSNIDINVAINTDRGLYSPLIKDADRLGLAGLNSAVKNLADKAKANKLSPPELESGTFTISNLGMYGIKQFTAVINPPQTCILAVGSTEQQVVVDKDNGFKAINVMNVTLSCDHRVVDGAVGAEWLSAFREYMEDPIRMLL